MTELLLNFLGLRRMARLLCSLLPPLLLALLFELEPVFTDWFADPNTREGVTRLFLLVGIPDIAEPPIWLPDAPWFLFRFPPCLTGVTRLPPWLPGVLRLPPWLVDALWLLLRLTPADGVIVLPSSVVSPKVTCGFLLLGILLYLGLFLFLLVEELEGAAVEAETPLELAGLPRLFLDLVGVT